MAESKENDREMVKYKLNKFKKLSYRKNPKKTVFEMTDPRFLQASARRICSENQPERGTFAQSAANKKPCNSPGVTK